MTIGHAMEPRPHLDQESAAVDVPPIEEWRARGAGARLVKWHRERMRSEQTLAPPYGERLVWVVVSFAAGITIATFFGLFVRAAGAG